MQLNDKIRGCYSSGSKNDASKLFSMQGSKLINFDQDIKFFLAGKEFKGSKLMTLDPCIENNLLRVGGHLQASLLDPDEKHPLILPFNCKVNNWLLPWKKVTQWH